FGTTIPITPLPIPIYTTTTIEIPGRKQELAALKKLETSVEALRQPLRLFAAYRRYQNDFNSYRPNVDVFIADYDNCHGCDASPQLVQALLIAGPATAGDISPMDDFPMVCRKPPDSVPFGNPPTNSVDPTPVTEDPDPLPGPIEPVPVGGSIDPND